jgi:hypothetical protein
VRRDGSSVVSTNIANVQFTYVDVRVASVSRRRALRSGGARVEIRGEHLNVGSQRAVRVRFDASSANMQTVQCTLSEANDTKLVCLMNHSPRSASGFLEVLVDDRVVSKEGTFPFDIVDQPRNIRLTYSRTILNGGLDYEVTGEDLDVVDTAMMHLVVLRSSDVEEETDEDDDAGVIQAGRSQCVVQNATRMACVMPSIDESVRASLILPANINVSFSFDDVTVKNVATVTVYGNPEFSDVDRNLDGVYDAGTTKLEYLTLDAKASLLISHYFTYHYIHKLLSYCLL